MRLHYCRCGKLSLHDEFDLRGIAGQQLPRTAEGNAELEIVLASEFATSGGTIEVTHPQLKETYQVRIPASAAEGTRLRLASAGPNGCDLFLKVVFYPSSSGIFVNEETCRACRSEQFTAQAHPAPETSKAAGANDNFSANSSAAAQSEIDKSVGRSGKLLFSRVRRGALLLLEFLLGFLSLNFGLGLLLAGIVLPFKLFFGENRPPLLTLIFAPLMPVLGFFLLRWTVREQSKSLLAAFYLEPLVSQAARGDFKPEPKRLFWVLLHLYKPLRSQGRFEAVSEILRAMAPSYGKSPAYWDVRTLLEQFDDAKREVRRRTRKGIWSRLPLLILLSFGGGEDNALVRVDKEGRVSTEWREGAADDESRLASFESQFIEKITKLMEWAKAEAV